MQGEGLFFRDMRAASDIPKLLTGRKYIVIAMTFSRLHIDLDRFHRLEYTIS